MFPHARTTPDTDDRSRTLTFFVGILWLKKLHRGIYIRHIIQYYPKFHKFKTPSSSHDKTLASSRPTKIFDHASKTSIHVSGKPRDVTSRGLPFVSVAQASTNDGVNLLLFQKLSHQKMVPLCVPPSKVIDPPRPTSKGGNNNSGIHTHSIHTYKHGDRRQLEPRLPLLHVKARHRMFPFSRPFFFNNAFLSSPYARTDNDQEQLVVCARTKQTQSINQCVCAYRTQEENKRQQ